MTAGTRRRGVPGLRAGAAGALAVGLLFGAPGCSRDDSAPSRTRTEPPAAAFGSATTDLCSEHGVLRAICTQCNPKLAAIFRANGDFCEEHGQPLSVCPVHHPERGGRPAVDVTKREAPPDRTRLRFRSRETAVQAGFVTVAARAEEIRSEVPATATLVADASRRAIVASAAAGVVRQIFAEEGARVEAGARLARVESGGIADARSRASAAVARLEAAEAARNREADLVSKGIAARKDLEKAEQELRTARAEAAAAEAALRAAGVDATGAGDDRTGALELRAPIAGIVTRRDAVVGRYVEPREALFEIVDPSRLWAEVEIAERLATGVAAGDEIRIHLGDPGSEPLGGTLVYVAPMVDERSRVVRARARLNDPDSRARVNAVHRATIRSGRGPSGVVVPREAIQEANGTMLAFVRLSDELYEARRVQTEPSSGGEIAVRRGLAPGDRVVTVGSFLLLTESDKSAIGTGCCEVEPPKR